MASLRRDLARGSVGGLREADLDGPTAALVAAWRDAGRGDWGALAARDDELASFAPGDVLFREAARERARWRIERGDRAASAEAVAILEAVLVRDWSPQDAELHARAALGAGSPRMAWGSLERIARRAFSDPNGRKLAQRALLLADDLPPELADPLRAQLRRSAGAVLDASEAVRVPRDPGGKS